MTWFGSHRSQHNGPVMLTGVVALSSRYVRISGAPLRDRATLPSPLRGLGPSGGYPSRLRSLRSLRAPLARVLDPSQLVV